MSKNEVEVDLTSLVGPHKFSAVGFGEEEVEGWGGKERASVMLFTLDGKTYKAIENPEDSYRSSMARLILTTEIPSEQFESIDVVGRYITEHEGMYGGKDDVLTLISVETGKVLLEVGTESIDDYYPGFVATFHKERM